MSELEEIRGIGNTTKEKLNEIGINSINELANSSLEDLEDGGIRQPKKILDRAEQRGIRIKTGEEIAQEQESKNHISTGLEPLDDALGGGYEPGFLVGVSGEHQAGKTQLIFQSLVAAAESTNKPVIYIETEPNRFQLDRIKSICSNEDTYKNIHKIEAYRADEDVDNLDVQLLAYNSIRENFDDVALIAIDSFVSNFRLSPRFKGRGDLKERSNVLQDHLRRIESVSSELDCPILMTLQVFGNPKQYDSSVPIWGGNLMKHTITCLVHMSHGKGQLREAQLRGHPGKENTEITLKIDQDGLESME